jgi:hypothetical protein
MDFYVAGPSGVYGPLDFHSARRVADEMNARYGVEADGEGSVHYIVVPAAAAAAAGWLA